MIRDIVMWLALVILYFYGSVYLQEYLRTNELYLNYFFQSRQQAENDDLFESWIKLLVT